MGISRYLRGRTVQNFFVSEVCVNSTASLSVPLAPAHACPGGSQQSLSLCGVCMARASWRTLWGFENFAVQQHGVAQIFLRLHSMKLSDT
jgi:hypothetical protein